MIKRQIHGCLEIPDLFHVLNVHMIYNRNKSGISAHHVLFSLYRYIKIVDSCLKWEKCLRVALS